MIESVITTLAELTEPIREHLSAFSQICLLVATVFFIAYIPWRKKEFALLGCVALIYGMAQFVV